MFGLVVQKLLIILSTWEGSIENDNLDRLRTALLSKKSD